MGSPRRLLRSGPFSASFLCSPSTSPFVVEQTEILGADFGEGSPTVAETCAADAPQQIVQVAQVLGQDRLSNANIGSVVEAGRTVRHGESECGGLTGYAPPPTPAQDDVSIRRRIWSRERQKKLSRRQPCVDTSVLGAILTAMVSGSGPIAGTDRQGANKVCEEGCSSVACAGGSLRRSPSSRQLLCCWCLYIACLSFFATTLARKSRNPTRLQPSVQ